MREFTIGTDAKICIKGIKCGRKAMQEFQVHHDGTSEGECRKQVSREYIKDILYKNKTNLTFKKYATNLKGVLNILERYVVNLYEEQ